MWPFWYHFGAVLVCGRFRLWPFLHVAVFGRTPYGLYRMVMLAITGRPITPQTISIYDFPTPFVSS